MNKKEIREIKRRMDPEKTGISRLYGCYVNSQKEIIARFDESLGLMESAEQEKYLTLLKKAFSGAPGRNLIDINFSTAQVAGSHEHSLLMDLRRTGLKDEVLLEEFYKLATQQLDMGADNYLLLMAYDSYDVPHFKEDGSSDEKDEREVFNYIVCCVCPVKTTNSVLSFSNEDKRFKTLSLSQIVAAPETGFMFPAFDDRTANIYAALFYNRDTKSIHREFIDAVFKAPSPLPVKRQQEAFSSAVSSALEKDCSIEMVSAVHGELREQLALHKESRSPEALTMYSDELEALLENAGMSEEHCDSFIARCNEEFGENTPIVVGNLITPGKFEIETESVKIKVDPDFSSLIRTEIIDGKKYILIPADGAVEVNGITVDLSQPQE